MRIYQPLYPDFSTKEVHRTDCDERYECIKKNADGFKDKTLVDIGCANGFFGFKFLKDKGRYVYGVDIDKGYLEFIDKTALDNGINFECGRDLKIRDFDYGIYLDLHYHEDTDECGYVEFLRDHCKTVFTSCTHRRNNDYQSRLGDLFNNIKPIYKGFQDRIIFKCE